MCILRLCVLIWANCISRAQYSQAAVRLDDIIPSHLLPSCWQLSLFFGPFLFHLYDKGIGEEQRWPVSGRLTPPLSFRTCGRHQ